MARDKNDKNDQIEITQIFALPCRTFLFQKYHILAKNEQNDPNFDILGFFTFLDKSCDHFLKPQDVRKWHILGQFLDPFLTTPWQIPTQIGYPPGASRSWPSKRGLILTPLFGLSRYCPIRGIYPHFLTHFWIKNGQKTGPKHLVFWGSRQKTLSRSQK